MAPNAPPLTTTTNTRPHPKQVRASFWDGTTDYSNRNFEREAKEEEQRHEEFGDYLDQQELPEELRVRTE